MLESKMESIPYPKGVVLICINEYFERFSFYGIRTTLPIFLKNGIGYDEDTATVIFHLFFMFSYFTPLIGASIADCFIGNYRTIVYFTFVYIIGNSLLSLSAIPVLSLPVIAFAATGLVLIALGSGGIKPCISTFGGDQFQLPFQAAKQLSFFAIFNWIIAAANLSATFLAPMLRSQVSCFGEDSCFSLMFFVALAFLILSIVFLIAGRSLYFIKKPQGNILVRVTKCIVTAISQKLKNSSNLNSHPFPEDCSKLARKPHWLDVSTEKHGVELVNDIKVVLRLLPLYVPLCFFWALYDQQSSRWTFQASRMDRNIFGFTFEPDQFQVTNRILLLILIPIFEKCFYPLLRKCNVLTSQLPRIFWGGIFAAVAFLFSGLLEIYLRESSAEGSSVHVTWQLPQLIAIVVAEIMFQISGMEFSYSEAPSSMKSLMQSVWLLTSAIGNLIVVLIAKFKFFEEQSLTTPWYIEYATIEKPEHEAKLRVPALAGDTFVNFWLAHLLEKNPGAPMLEYEFFLFSGLMFINMLIFAVIAVKYTKRKHKIKEEPSKSTWEDNLGFQPDP